MRSPLTSLAVLASVLSFSTPAAVASEDAFANGWALQPEISTLNFVSVKKGALMEVSRFATLEGTIDESGKATVTVPLDSVDTSVDLRNVRMRFMLFETFNNPTATITAQLTPDMVVGLEAVGTRTQMVPVEVTLNGVTLPMEAEVQVALSGRDRVSISSVKPVVLKLEDFNLLTGLARLEEAAKVTIVPQTSVTFNLHMARNGTDPSAPLVQLAAASISQVEPISVALEPEGPLSHAACLGRFEILSKSGNIHFEVGSAYLVSSSRPILETVSQIVSRCPDMTVEVAGFTDSIGHSGHNHALSQARADAVRRALVSMGADPASLVSVGYGEANPIASNRTASGRSKNRRIEFHVR